jgi:hypothetical protein
MLQQAQRLLRLLQHGPVLAERAQQALRGPLAFAP